MQFIMPFVKSGKQQQGNLLILPELENKNIDDIQVGLNDEIQSDHEQGLSDILTNEEKSNNQKTISHGAKKLKLNNKASDVESCFIEYFETKKKNLTTTPECADQKFLLSLLPDMQQMNSTQKRQFKRKVLDIIACILEDSDSINISSRSSAASYSSSPIIPESRTDNQYQQYDPADSGFGYFNIQ